MGNWIYESPDGGRTLYKREVSTLQLEKVILLDNGMWIEEAVAVSILQRQSLEQAIREQNPAAQDLWEQYQTMINLVDRT